MIGSYNYWARPGWAIRLGDDSVSSNTTYKVYIEAKMRHMLDEGNN